jgi:sugar lactone lactonase YvrE
MRAERLTDAVAYHGEGPVWSGRWGGLRWVDMLAGDVLSLADDGSIERRHVGDVVAALRPRAGGGAVLAVERGFALEDPDGTLTTLPPIWRHDGVRMNEGGCDPEGRFYCGSMAYDERPGGGALHRLDPDGSVHCVLDGVTISNGLEWSPDGALAYYADTATHRIDVFDYDCESGLTGRRPFVRLSDHGNPDGLTVDADGGVWVAMYGSGAVHRYTPEGTLDAVVEVATAQVTACAFGGAALDQLFVTTSRERMAPDDDPLAGSLFIADVGVSGRPVREFAG